MINSYISATMNKLYLLAFILFAACKPKPTSVPVSAPPAPQAAAPQTQKTDPGPEDVKSVPTDMQGIRKAYAYIIAQRKRHVFDSTVYDYTCEGDGGTITYFFEGSDLRLIDCLFGDDHIDTHEQYFLKDTTLFFIYHGLSGFNQVDETRTYIINRQPFKCLQKVYELNNDTPPENIPNKEVKCWSYEMIVENYQKYLKYWLDPAAECPEENSDN